MDGITPLACIEDNPTSRSIWFAGEYISLSQVSRETNIDMGYLSRIFQGKQKPSMRVARQIAEALLMDLGSFAAALDQVQSTT